MSSILMFALVLSVILPGQLGSTAASSTGTATVSASVERVGFPVEDCATVAAATGVGALTLAGAGYAGTVASASSLFFSTSAATFHSVLGSIALAIKEPGHNCTQYIGNSAATAICNASHFSAWDPRGRAARSIVRLATANQYSRC